MAAAVKPGGWLFTCEPDFNLVRTSEPQVWREAWAGIIKWGESQGVNWFIGRNLPMIRDRAIGAASSTQRRSMRPPPCSTIPIAGRSVGCLRACGSASLTTNTIIPTPA